MTQSYFAEDAAHSRMIDPWEYAPTPGNFGSTPATLYSPSPAPYRATEQPLSDQLDFLPSAEWEEGGEYDEEPPKYVCYTIEWKVILNRKAVGRVTEENLVVAPSEYWDETLKAVGGMLQMKKKRHQRVRSEGTDITIKSNDRSQRKIEKFYDSTNIDWKPVEKQLRKWSNLLRIGKKLTIVIAFNYRSEDDDQSTSASRRVDKRPRVSATSRMAAEREAHIATEEERTGRTATWSLVYDRMRCNVRSCPLRSDWCWEDPTDKKHYKLRTPHLERLIEHVDDGGNLDCHDDVPSDIRRDLVLESQIGRKSKKTDTTSTGPPYPPTIINVLPAQAATASTLTSFLPKHTPNEPLVIPGSREAAVRDYCGWLESRATDEEYKADFRKVCQVTLENHLDLELILEEPDAGFFVQQGVRIGTARRFLRDINEWATVIKSSMILEQDAREILDHCEQFS
jgi:organic radical activating enzyme